MSAIAWAAAFRRLCVETRLAERYDAIATAAAFRRLCVETLECFLQDYVY